MLKDPPAVNDSAPGKGALEMPADVQAMFARIAARYDLVNAILSGGLDYYWRRKAARLVAGWQPGNLLDLATGSGVLAGTLARACPETEIVGADFSLPMLQRARASGRVARLVAADAMQLPFASGVFDAVTVAFGLRNMASYGDALREMRRVLRPGGHVLILDFSVPGGWWRNLYRVYLHRCLPTVAGIFCGERAAYRYLGESIERFPRGEHMRALLSESGFTEPSAQELCGGIVSLYTAVAPAVTKTTPSN